MASTFVKQIMKKNVITIDGSMSVQEAAQMMTDANVGCVIVTIKDKPIGIITERDFVTRIAAEGIGLFSEVSYVMSKPLITISPEETVWDAAEIMRVKGIHKLPVQEGNEIVGIITTTDFVKICSYGSDSQMRNICDQIMLRMNPSSNVEAGLN